MNNPISFDSIESVATYLRAKLNDKKFILLFAYNGTGKTRLSVVFKNRGKRTTTHEMVTESGEAITAQTGEVLTGTSLQGDTLYFNAFTEDLFHWDNDIEADQNHALKINTSSKFFSGLKELEMENRIGPLFQRYADLNFYIDYDNGNVRFERDIPDGKTTKKAENIKISRGEENIFIWCFFLAVAHLAIDKQETYKWVKYIYVDDPVSSLDDNNAIAVACHLAEILNGEKNDIRAIISTHHSLFFNVMWNELRPDRRGSQTHPYFLHKGDGSNQFTLRYTGDSPFFHHVALLKELRELSLNGKLYTYHFNILRNILERTASFHGYKHFSECIKMEDEDDALHTRMIQVLSHGDYSLFEPKEMGDDTKKLFKHILSNFLRNYRFNPELFKSQDTAKVSQL